MRRIFTQLSGKYIATIGVFWLPASRLRDFPDRNTAIHPYACDARAYSRRVDFPICPKCGTVIGVYESVAWQMPDRSAIASFYVPRGTEVEAALDGRASACTAPARSRTSCSTKNSKAMLFTARVSRENPQGGVDCGSYGPKTRISARRFNRDPPSGNTHWHGRR